MNAKGKLDVIPIIKNMFQDLELEDDCMEVINRFPIVAERLKSTANRNVPNNIKMETKSLGKGKNSNKNSKTAANQINCLPYILYILLERMGRSQVWKNRYQNW